MSKKCCFMVILVLFMYAEPLVFGEKNLEEASRFLLSSDYEPKEVEGFTVLVSPELAAHPELAGRALTVARGQLFYVGLVMPAEVVKKLRGVKIWMEYANPRNRGACHHPSRRWLVANGYNPDKEDSIEIGNARNFVNWSRQQPCMLLHELAHAWHHQFVGNDEPRIRAAYEKAKASGRYDSVLHISGKRKVHYAMNNALEYFAECSEAYFGTNDFYPFVRAELAEFDPEMTALLEEIWEVKGK